MRNVAATVVCALTLLLARSSSADDLGALVVKAETSARDQEVAMRAAKDTLAAAKWKLADKPLTAAETTAIARCFSQSAAPDCVLRAVADKRARRIAYLSIGKDPKRGPSSVAIIGRMVVEGVDTIMLATRYCDHCTDDTLTSYVVEATKELVDRASIASGRTVISVKSTPQGARFSIDGHALGATDAAITVAPGKHRVRIEQDGFITEERTVEAVEGKTAEVTVTLRRADASTSTNSTNSSTTSTSAATAPDESTVTPPHASGAPLVLMGVGGAAVVGGVVALLLDQDDDVRKPRGEVQPRYYYDTALPGAIAVAGGATALVVGWLWKRRAGTASTIGSKPVSGGAVLTFTSEF